MNGTPFLVLMTHGLRYWAVYDEGSEDYEVHASPDADDYVGSACTVYGCKLLAEQHARDNRKAA